MDPRGSLHHDPGRSLRIAICVVTRGRPEELAGLLASLDRQEGLPAHAEVRVVVVDNDARGSAEPACRALQQELRFPLLYRVEKRPGIPQARNAALALALPWAAFVAFTDDDSRPCPGWLAELLAAQERFAADAVTGPIPMRFRAPVPAWLAAAFELPSGFPEGSLRPAAFTGNVLVRCAALEQLDALFDESLAETGGSDAELFRRFARRGFRIVWAPAAQVEEQVPAWRCRVSWVLRRAYRVGVCDALLRRRHEPGIAPALALVAQALWCALRGGALLPLTPLRGRRRGLAAATLLATGVGRLAGVCGLRFREYARPAPGPAAGS